METELIAALYAGPLDTFVQRRDAIAKALRAEKRRDDADAVKKLRKPARTAWALNVAARDASAELQGLLSAAHGMVEAHNGGDVRAAIARLRGAVRDYATRASALSAVPEPDLNSALLAVLGSPESLEALRTGTLSDVPAAGGLDVLALLSVAPPVVSDIEVRREAVRRSRAAVSAARERATAIQRALTNTEARLAVAEQQLRQLNAELEKLAAERAQLREDAAMAEAALADAEQNLLELPGAHEAD